MPNARRVLPILASLLLVFWSSPLLGQGNAAGPGPQTVEESARPAESTRPQEVSAEAIDALARRVAESPNISAADRERIDTALRTAQESLSAQAQRASAGEQFRTQANEAPQRIAEIRERLLRQREEVDRARFAEMSLAEMEAELARARSELARHQQEITRLEGEPERRTARRAALRELQPQRESELATVEQALAAPPDDAVDAIVTRAQRYQLLARQRELRTRIATNNEELRYLDATDTAIGPQLELEVRRRDRAQQEVAFLQQRVDEIRRDTARVRTERARELARLTAAQPAQVPEFAERNIELAQALAEMTQRVGDLETSVDRQRAELSRVLADFERTRERVRAIGLDAALGAVLKRARANLPDQRRLTQQIENRRREYSEIELMRFDVLEERPLITEYREKLNQALPEADRERYSVAVSELVELRRDLVNDLIGLATRYGSRWSDYDKTVGDLRIVSGGFASFIDERVLWIRSHSVLGDWSPARLARLVEYAGSPGAWRRWVEAVVRSPLTTLGAALIAMLAILVNPPLRKWARSFDELARKREGMKVSITLKAMLAELLVVTPMAAILFAAGVSLRQAPDGMPVAVGLALGDAAWIVLSLRFFQRLLRPGGVAINHFRWNNTSTGIVRRHLRWYIPLITISYASLRAAESMSEQLDPLDTIGRTAFIVAMAAVGAFVWCVARPSGTVMAPFLKANKGGWLDRTRYLWFDAAIAAPAVLIVLAALGFVYTASEIEDRFRLTLGLVLGLILIGGVLQRWLYIARRKLAIEQAIRAREARLAELKAQAEQAEKAEKGEVPEEPKQKGEEIDKVDEDKVNIPGLDAQTRHLIRFAITITLVMSLWGIWNPVLPALNMLDRVELYPRLTIADEREQTESPEVLEALQRYRGEPAPAPLLTDDEGLPPVETPAREATPGSPAFPGMPPGGMTPGLEPRPAEEQAGLPLTDALTLSDLLTAIVFTVIAFVAVRNVPAVIEIILLQRLPLDSGGRFAVSTIVRYILTGIGIFVVAGAVGISWTNVQWLVAALTFGLAFGLQEIFANFVSGIIILLERPIRVGDVVTVGDTSGRISKIQMRATTITDWDRKELIVPNREFITGRVINWSLSEDTLRVVVEVGIAYGADTKLAHETLLRVAREHPDVMKDPEPSCWFMGFGDNSLNFRLAAFVPHISLNLSTRHSLHMKIDEEFRKAGLEISFPQRDLHLRSIDDKVVKLFKDAGDQIRPSDNSPPLKSSDQKSG
ncbi:MAG: mechanosensitive ion channel [Phycisphaerales bacterium]|nr:mechanosensitive ion channel [Phycisphaerales bacterium]